MIGDQIKYEPGWVKDHPEYKNRDIPTLVKHGAQKKLLRDLKIDDNLKSFSQALDLNDFRSSC